MGGRRLGQGGGEGNAQWTGERSSCIRVRRSSTGDVALSFDDGAGYSLLFASDGFDSWVGRLVQCSEEDD